MYILILNDRCWVTLKDQCHILCSVFVEERVLVVNALVPVHVQECELVGLLAYLKMNLLFPSALTARVFSLELDDPGLFVSSFFREYNH